jgi:hypothetical protein
MSVCPLSSGGSPASTDRIGFPSYEDVTQSAHLTRPTEAFAVLKRRTFLEYALRTHFAPPHQCIACRQLRSRRTQRHKPQPYWLNPLTSSPVFSSIVSQGSRAGEGTLFWLRVAEAVGLVLSVSPQTECERSGSGLGRTLRESWTGDRLCYQEADSLSAARSRPGRGEDVRPRIDTRGADPYAPEP